MAVRRPVTLVCMRADVIRDHLERHRLDEVAEVVGVGTRFEDFRDRLDEVEVILSGWATPPIDAEVLARLPRLRIVCHTAGSVKKMVTPELVERGVVVTNVVGENADPVAQFTLGVMLLAAKDTFWLIPRARQLQDSHVRDDAYQDLAAWRRTIGVIGFSRVGRRVVEALNDPYLRRTLQPRVLVSDPYADPREVAAAGAELVDLDTLLSSSQTVSLHAPNIPQTRHMLGAPQFALMRDGAVFVNTARGALVDHEALVAECSSGRLKAVLDVTDPEPLPDDSPLLSCPGIVITPHVAGSLGNEITRLVDTAIDEVERFAQGQPPREPVDLADLARLA